MIGIFPSFSTSLLVLACVAPVAGAENIDENALFSDTSSTVDSASIVKSSGISSKAESTTVEFSGNITSAIEATASRAWFDSLNRQDISLNAYIDGNFFLDVRLPFDMKAFGNMETEYFPDSTKTDLFLRELFIDANFNKLIFIRTGKQVLQWGQCYFWNPTDLINVDHKQFIQKIGSLEGTYGVRVSVPFGSRWNVTGFLDMNKLGSVDSLAGAVKAELLLGGTEMSVSGWDKRGKDPYLGLDFSTGLFNYTITGELSLTDGTNYQVPRQNFLDYIFTPNASSDSIFTTLGRGNIITRVSVGILKTFDFLNIRDRISTDLEFYFNQAGDDGNEFGQPKVVAIRDAMFNNPSQAQNFQGLLYSFYEPNSYSKYYVAFFGSLNEFLINPLSLQINAIVNPNLACAVLTTGITYATQHNFTAGVSVNSFIGLANTEYTFLNQAFLVRLTAGMGF